MALVDTGNGNADIIYTQKFPVQFGHIEYNADKRRHYVHWSKLAMCTLERYKLDHWDTQFYKEMAADFRSKAAS